jgi:hypothetical protein
LGLRKIWLFFGLGSDDGVFALPALLKFNTGVPVAVFGGMIFVVGCAGFTVGVSGSNSVYERV